ncbi:hypothetical protein P280DRAFT_552813 [Massarina eburnea CBS 473.64]|uniref:F-box domain-containing protein n=1 Tax=Massarina eburnea CBS 473.64 TaxID=1395130 RepID=A0A6A6RQV6_9PLEO|nr:hypothetical protein P280DRAFT_552813 [Massarina eburnea CBS 473.64]
MALLELPNKLTCKRSMNDSDSSESKDPKKEATVEQTSPEAITRRNQIQSPLLRLPEEVRNKIYNYAIGGHNTSNAWYWDLSTVLSLSYVSKQLYHDTRYRIFSLNEFYYGI